MTLDQQLEADVRSICKDLYDMDVEEQHAWIRALVRLKPQTATTEFIKGWSRANASYLRSVI